MSDWYYYNKNGEKIGPVSVSALKGLARQGLITRDTIIENQNGRSSPAGKVNGLTFPDILPTDQGHIASPVMGETYGMVLQELPPKPTAAIVPVSTVSVPLPLEAAPKGSCPDCGFNFAWDGNRCGHCGYGVGLDRENQEWLKRVRRERDVRAQQKKQEQDDRAAKEEQEFEQELEAYSMSFKENCGKIGGNLTEWGFLLSVSGGYWLGRGLITANAICLSVGYIMSGIGGFMFFVGPILLVVHCVVPGKCFFSIGEWFLGVIGRVLFVVLVLFLIIFCINKFG